MTSHTDVGSSGRFHLGQTWQGKTIQSIDVVGPALADVAIRPTLLNVDQSQVVAYFDPSRRLTIARRDSPRKCWNFVHIDSKIGWDSHNYIDLGLDQSGHLHVAGNMHASPMQYWVLNLHDFDKGARQLPVLSNEAQEKRVTYPRFLRDKEGGLLFTYRNGTSGDGDFVCLAWNDKTRRHEAISSRPLIDGGGRRNPYLDTNAPILGPDGAWHMLWVWRNSPEAESTHTVNYATSADLTRWQASDGTLLNHPIAADAEVIVDPVPPGHGLINNNVRLGFLPGGQPIAVYHRRDGSGFQQIWAATPGPERWDTRQLTDWDFRWDFAGRGSLDFQIEIGAPSTTGDGISVEVRRGSRVESLNVDRGLHLLQVQPAPPWSCLRRTALDEGLYQRTTPSQVWASRENDPEWCLLHSSLPEQRDQAPAEYKPAPQPLSVLKIC